MHVGLKLVVCEVADSSAFIERYNNASFLSGHIEVIQYDKPDLEEPTILQIMNLPESFSPETIMRHLKLPQAYILDFDSDVIILEIEKKDAIDISSADWPPISGSQLEFQVTFRHNHS